MIIKVLKADCEKVGSLINSNIYALPFYINGCNHLREEYHDVFGFGGLSIGEFGTMFVSKFFLHTEYDSLYFVLDSRLISIENKWL